MTTTPTFADIRAYALDRADADTAARVRRYLLLTADDDALAWVTSLAEARDRVTQLDRSQRGTTLLQQVLAELGLQWPDMPAGPARFGVSMSQTAGMLMASVTRADMSVRLVSDVPRLLYVVGVSVLGAAHVLYPTEDIPSAPETASAELTIPEDMVGFIGITAAAPLVPWDILANPAAARRLLLLATDSYRREDIALCTWQRDYNG